MPKKATFSFWFLKAEIILLLLQVHRACSVINRAIVFIKKISMCIRLANAIKMGEKRKGS